MDMQRGGPFVIDGFRLTAGRDGVASTAAPFCFNWVEVSGAFHLLMQLSLIRN
jgi:hypothetical protein